MTERKAITEKMKIKCLIHRYSIGCGLCGLWLQVEDEIEWDHIHAICHNGPHEYINLRPVHAECHKRKTAQDIKANAKVKRLRNPKPSRRPMQPSGRKIPSRPFPKRASQRQ